MKDKEIGEIRRHIRRDRSNMTAIYGCFVSEGKEIISKFRLSTGMMPENESDKYFALMKGSSPAPRARISSTSASAPSRWWTAPSTSS